MVSERRGVGRPGHRIDVGRVGELHGQGVPTWAIAERMGFSESAVARAMTRAKATRATTRQRRCQDSSSSSYQEAVEKSVIKDAIVSRGAAATSQVQCQPPGAKPSGVKPSSNRPL